MDPMGTDPRAGRGRARKEMEKEEYKELDVRTRDDVYRKSVAESFRKRKGQAFSLEQIV